MSLLEQVRQQGRRLEAALEAGQHALAQERIEEMRRLVDEGLPKAPAAERAPVARLAAEFLLRLKGKLESNRGRMAEELAALRCVAAYRARGANYGHIWELHG